MSLKIKGRRKIIEYSLILLCVVLFLVFLVRVITFENAYYNEKQGSERSVGAVVEIRDDLIEEKPSDGEVREYTVAADRPRYLTINKLNVKNARVLPMGINAKGELDTPQNIFDVGWYEASGKPGQGGTMVIDGHNGGPHVHGVFKDLPALAKGDEIKIERGDGKILKYSVVENTDVLLSEADVYMAKAFRSPEAGKEALTLISCTGEWSQTQGTYLSRQFTRAVLVDD